VGDVNLTTVDGFLLPLSMGQRRIFEMSHVIHFKDRKGSQIQTVGHITWPRPWWQLAFAR